MPGYRPAIDSVFGSRGELDYNLIDSNAAEDSVYATALMKMLALPGSPFTRRALFDLFFNPCFLAGNNLRREDAVTWLAWAEELGVFHSFDDAHRRQQGLIEGEQFTWQQALRRIRLGRIMPHEPSRHMPDIPSAFDRYPPHADMQTGGWTADRFSETVERLFHRLNELAVARLDRPTWAARIQSLMDDFLGIPAEYAGESYVHQCLAAYLLQLAGKDDSHGPGLLQRDMPLTLIRQMLQDSLSTVPCGRGRYLVDGITIAALLPMRPIPFRIVYILGLNEGQFPRDIERSSLDLRHCRRRIGDVSRPDAGRYIFLENMLTARGKLYLSYVNLDLVKDEEKFPSPVIRQLVDFVNGCVLEPDTRFQENNIPFHAGSPVRKPPPGKRETEALRDFGKETFRIESLLAANAHQNMPPDLTRQLEAYVQQHPHSETAHRIKAFLQAMQGSAETAAPANTAQPDPPETVQIDVRDLARFLADPVEAYVRYHLGLYDRNDDGIEAALCEHEPLASSFPEDYELITSTMAAWFRSGNDEDVARETFDRLYKRLQHSSRCPEAVYGQADRDKLWDHVIAERIEQCWKHGPKDKAQSVLIGNSRIYEQIPDIRIPSPLILHNVLLENGRTVQVELSGFFELTWGRPAAGNIHLLALTKSLQQRRDRPPRHILRPFLFGLVWLLHSTTAECCFYAGVPVAARKTAGLFGPQWFGYRYTRQAAENYLTGLVKAYLDEQRPKLLPYDILQHATALDAEHLQRAIDAELLSDSAYGRHYSPSDLVTLFLDQLRVPADAQDVVQQRIGPVWDCEQKEHSV
jgi:exonuclease V gamma subunit